MKSKTYSQGFSNINNHTSRPKFSWSKYYQIKSKDKKFLLGKKLKEYTLIYTLETMTEVHGISKLSED